ncbi:MAG: FeoB-associated Cys-rich membrane protein [Treponemataceae bacterium]|nr:FeoB-associated Cys-rich membrane protein [Treponemataceae bacterium]
MNIQSWIILIIVAACVVLAVRIYRRKGTTCNCGCSDCTGSSRCHSGKKKK